jgi:protein SCO1/2
MTFIFTRCPFPNFCPRLSGNFADAAGRLAAQAAPTNWHLLSVSFDPDNDTPEVLRRYAESYRADPERWSFATGDMEEIDALTEQFGLVFGRDGDSISHNARTAVLDPEGRVSLIITGNEWSVEELVEAMTAAARSGGDTVERDE